MPNELVQKRAVDQEKVVADVAKERTTSESTVMTGAKPGDVAWDWIWFFDDKLFT